LFVDGNYQHSRNKVYLIQYHLWCPKRRKPVLAGKIKERLEQIIYEVADELGIKVLKPAINPDHLHLFVSAHPAIPVHKIVKNPKTGVS